MMEKIIWRQILQHRFTILSSFSLMKISKNQTFLATRRQNFDFKGIWNQCPSGVGIAYTLGITENVYVDAMDELRGGVTVPSARSRRNNMRSYNVRLGDEYTSMPAAIAEQIVDTLSLTDADTIKNRTNAKNVLKALIIQLGNHEEFRILLKDLYSHGGF